MRRFLGIYLFIVLFSFSSYAQTVNGIIAEETGCGVPYANIALFDNEKIIAAVTADSCGVFSVTFSKLTTPRLRMSAVGYESVDTVISSLNESVSIVMRRSPVALDEVVVRHIPPVVSMKGDVLVTNVAGSTLQHIGTAKDVLRHVPLLTIGNDESVEVFGRGMPLVYINGRKVNDLRELNQLQSENIKSIEVITNPGAKYSAETMAVVIIRTGKPRGEGLNAAAGVSESYDSDFMTSADLSLRYRKDGLEVFADGSFSNGRHAYTTGNDQWSTDREGTLRQNAISDRVADMRWGAVKAGLSYQIGADHSIGAFYNYSYWRKYETLDNIQDITLNGVATDCWLMNGIDTTLSAPTHNVNVYYNGQISHWTLDLNADYFERDNTHNFVFNEQNSKAYHNDIFIKNSGLSRMFAEKVVASYRNGKMTLDIGEEFTHSHLTSQSDNIGAPFVGSSTRVTEYNFAPFAELRYSWRSISAGVGLRYERTVNEFAVCGQQSDSRTLHYSRLFPSASITWSDNGANLGLSFTNKSVRPTYSQLSDILEYSTRTKYWRGNPGLDSEKHYNVQLSASWKYFFGQLMYTHTTDAIFQTYEPYENDPDVSLITYRNIASLNNVNAMIGFRHTVGIWSPTITLSLNKQWHHIETLEGRKALSSPIGRIRYDNAFRFSDDWTGMVSFDFTTGGNNHNHGYKSRHSLDASVTKSFMKGDLIVTAAATDLLKHSYLRYSIYNEVGRITCLDTWPNRSVRISLRYSFNTASSLYRGRGAGATERSRF